MSSPITRLPRVSMFAWSASVDGRINQYWRVAVLAAVTDWFTKWFVVGHYTMGREHTFADRLSLFVTFNTGSAGGVMFGEHTVSVNVLVTIVALVLISMVVRDLSAVDPRASVALGLVAGGASGNLASMLFGPPGVADFIAVRFSHQTTVILNIADLALWTGALLLLPVVFRLVMAIRAEKQRFGRRVEGRTESRA